MDFHSLKFVQAQKVEAFQLSSSALCALFTLHCSTEWKKTNTKRGAFINNTRARFLRAHINKYFGKALPLGFYFVPSNQRITSINLRFVHGVLNLENHGLYGIWKYSFAGHLTGKQKRTYYFKTIFCDK